MGWIARILEARDKHHSGAAGATTKSKRHSPAPKQAQNNVAHPFRGVRIYSNSACCEAAHRLEGRLFLAAHAPQLPLGGCTQVDQCKCRYKHLEDRRQDLRRDTDHGLPQRSFSDADRRCRGDRRHFSA